MLNIVFSVNLINPLTKGFINKKRQKTNAKIIEWTDYRERSETKTHFKLNKYNRILPKSGNLYPPVFKRRERKKKKPKNESNISKQL